ncbi:hypothetical protein [Falsiroseomonas sp.]
MTDIVDRLRRDATCTTHYEAAEIRALDTAREVMHRRAGALRDMEDGRHD